MSLEQRTNLTFPRLPLPRPTRLQSSSYSCSGGCREQRPTAVGHAGSQTLSRLCRNQSWPMCERTESCEAQIHWLGCPCSPLSSPLPPLFHSSGTPGSLPHDLRMGVMSPQCVPLSALFPGQGS